MPFFGTIIIRRKWFHGGCFSSLVVYILQVVFFFNIIMKLNVKKAWL